jgi:AcrR family transcriptional regulator
MQANVNTKEDLVQEQILAAAKRLFQVYGLAKVTMDDVAKAIGKGRSSIYYYYKSKDEIFDAVFAKEIQEMITIVQRAVNNAGTAEEKIRAFCIAKLQVQQEKQAFFSTLDMGMDADELSRFSQAKIRHHNQIIKLETGLIEQILAFGIQHGQIKTMTKAQQERVIFVLLCGLHGIKREIRLINSYDNMEDIVQTFTCIMMHGLSK